MFISVNHFSLKYTESIFKWPCFYSNGLAHCQWNQWWKTSKNYLHREHFFLLLCWSSFYKLLSQVGQVFALLLGPALPSSGTIVLPIGSDFIWHIAARLCLAEAALQQVPRHFHPIHAGNCLFSYWALSIRFFNKLYKYNIGLQRLLRRITILFYSLWIFLLDTNMFLVGLSLRPKNSLFLTSAISLWGMVKKFQTSTES